MKIIAESAFNHNGSLEYLKKLFLASVEAKADFFTFQVMDVASFCVAEYSKYDIYKNNTLTFREWEKFFESSSENDISLIPCVLDMESLQFCYERGFRLLKLHATDITNIPMLNYIMERKDITVILETQCTTSLEVNFAMQRIGTQVECIMHGFSNYPTEIEDLNLNSIDYLKEHFPKIKVGLADHSIDTEGIPLMALAKGCEYLEKHITVSRNHRNFDYQVSLYPFEFAKMVSSIRHYEKALGIKMKHPVKSELAYRNIIYKKYLSNGEFKRSDEGIDFITHTMNGLNRMHIGITLIARLKSQRLSKKVLRPFGDTVLIDFLYRRLNTSETVQKTVLATSNLPEDQELANIGLQNSYNVYQGHPESVLDRMLELALQEKWGAIVRVTGDNPFTDVKLIDEMVELFLQNELDYVRVNNAPFGISAELFSTKYLWNLYLNMDNPMGSEYLSWFVLNDEYAHKGCIDIVSNIDNLGLINLSIDYPKDLERAYEILKKVKADQQDANKLYLADLVPYLKDMDREDANKYIKLPGSQIKFSDFLDLIANQNYIVRKTINI